MPIRDVSGLSIAELISLRGRVVVVTGGARGIGFAIASRLAEAGASVMIADLDVAAARASADRLGERFDVTVRASPLDVSDSTSVSATADMAVAELGGIDVWVNNAGVYPSTPVLEMSDEDWNRVLQVNLGGTFAGAREAAIRMVRAGRGGVIVNVSSVAGIRGRGPGITHYVASKHGIIGLTKQLALEFAETGIRVVAVAPSIIITPGVEEKLDGHGDLNQMLAGPLGRAGLPDDVARVVLFCASDLSMFMTGSTLLVDGGDMAR